MAKRKPALTALAKRQQDLTAVNLPPEAATLPRQADITVTRAGEQRARATDDKRAGHDTARRQDAFDALRAGLAPGCFDAAKRLERDILTRLGRGDRCVLGERVDASRGAADRAIVAGLRVDEVRDRIPPRDFWLLTELIAPPIDRGTWRDHVAYVTGERHDHGQSAAVRASCVNLRDAYSAIDRVPLAKRVAA